MSEVELKIGLDVIRSYRRLAYTPWYALAEFVDNSTQSYRSNQTVLDAVYGREGTQLRVMIDYNRHADLLSVKDNAMGMSFGELQRALHIGRPPAVTTGRSQFGLGLKTAACWFGDRWEVRTKKLGETTGYAVTVNVEEVANSSSLALPVEEFEAKQDEHYTEIRIENLHVVLHGRRLGKTKDSLKSMYRVDIREGRLELMWDGQSLEWRDDLEFLTVDNKVAKNEFEFEVDKRRVAGWAGVLAPGSSGRSNAGFALIRRGRLIRGWPESWRPEAIFGPSPGRNDLINQRVTGEVHLDNFDVTHTKDDILWQGDELDEVQDGIKERIESLLKIAREFRHEKKPASPAVVRDQKVEIDALIEDSDLGAKIRSAGCEIEEILNDLAPSEILQLAADAIVQSQENEVSLLELAIGKSQSLRLLSSRVVGADASYLASTRRADRWVLLVNASHPVCSSLEDAEALRVHVQHVIADGLVMWAFDRGRLGQSPSTMLTLKDALLRIFAEG